MRTDKKRNDERILDAAARLFYEISVEGVSLDEIAREAEVTRATLYNHFGDKRTLIARLVEPALAEGISLLDALLESPSAGLRSLTDALWDLYKRFFRPMEISGCREASGIESVRHLHREFVGRFTRYVQRIEEEEGALTLGTEPSVRLMGTLYIPVLQELSRDEDTNVPEQFHRIMQGVLR